jgi:hypothetical protein
MKNGKDLSATHIGEAFITDGAVSNTTMDVA